MKTCLHEQSTAYAMTNRLAWEQPYIRVQRMIRGVVLCNDINESLLCIISVFENTSNETNIHQHLMKLQPLYVCISPDCLTPKSQIFTIKTLYSKKSHLIVQYKFDQAKKQQCVVIRHLNKVQS